MKHLKAYIEQENKWVSIFNGKPYSIDTAAERHRLADHIDCALSPENLSCDGEVRGAALQNKLKALTRVARELKELDPSVNIYELY